MSRVFGYDRVGPIGYYKSEILLEYFLGGEIELAVKYKQF